MKNTLLSFILIIFSFAGFSQASGLKVINNSNCYALFRIFGSEDCSCRMDYYSNLIGVPSGGILYLTNTTHWLIGGNFPISTPAYVHSVVMYGSKVCQDPYISPLFGEPACGYPTSVPFSTQDWGCANLCDRLVAQWLHDDLSCEGTAYLTILDL